MHRMRFWAGLRRAALFSVPAILISVVFAPVILQAAALSKTDTQFMKTAALANMTEAHLGQMAESQGSQQSVKDFGKKLSADHTNSYEGLTVLANKIGEPIPKAISKTKTIDRLTRLKGKSFDRSFVQDEIQTDQSTLAAFKDEADHGENPDLKAWAKNMIPVIEGDLRTAQDLAKQAKPTK